MTRRRTVDVYTTAQTPRLTGGRATSLTVLILSRLKQESYAICKADMLIKGQDIAHTA